MTSLPFEANERHGSEGLNIGTDIAVADEFGIVVLHQKQAHRSPEAA
jgi:hypothetical protein